MTEMRHDMRSVYSKYAIIYYLSSPSVSLLRSPDDAYWVTWSERVDMSPKCLDREGLGRRRTGTGRIT